MLILRKSRQVPGQQDCVCGGGDYCFQSVPTYQYLGSIVNEDFNKKEKGIN